MFKQPNIQKPQNEKGSKYGYNKKRPIKNLQLVKISPIRFFINCKQIVNQGGENQSIGYVYIKLVQLIDIRTKDPLLYVKKLKTIQRHDYVCNNKKTFKIDYQFGYAIMRYNIKQVHQGNGKKQPVKGGKNTYLISYFVQKGKRGAYCHEN